MNRFVFIFLLLLVGCIKLLLWLQSPLYSLAGFGECFIFIFAFAIWLHQLFKKTAVCWKSLVLILTTYSTVSTLYALPHLKKENSEKELTVVNYNVHVFNSYMNLQSPGMTTTTEMIDWVEKVDADVLCLQEFYNRPRSNDLNVVLRLKKKYPRHYYDIGTRNGAGNTYGAIVFSKHPIIEYKELKHDKEVNGSFYIDIVKNKDTMRVYSCHLESNKFKESQINAISTAEGKKTFLGKYLETAKIRIQQVEKIIDHANQSPHPFIICGDFNDTPISVVYKSLRNNFKDAFLEAGTGYGSTFHHKKLPNIRIDYQFHSDDFVCNKITVAKEMPHSDHFPLIGVYSLKKQSD